MFRLKPSRKPGRQLSAEELKAKRKKDFWTLDLPLVFGLTLCTTFTFITGVRGLDGNGRALAYAFQWPVIGAIIVWIWFRYKREGLTSGEEEPQPGDDSTGAEVGPAPKKKSRSLGFANHYKARIEEAGAEYAAALHAADEVDRAPAIPASDEGLRDWKAYVADLNRREPPGHPPNSNS
jgi:hypothetical protein